MARKRWLRTRCQALDMPRKFDEEEESEQIYLWYDMGKHSRVLYGSTRNVFGHSATLSFDPMGTISDGNQFCRVPNAVLSYTILLAL